MACFDIFLPQLSEHSVVLTVYGDDDACFLSGSKHAKQLIITQPVIICHIDFEARDAFLLLDL